MNEWINNPVLQSMDPIKLELIRRASSQTAGKSGKELVPIMMALITSANKQNIKFSSDEISLILDLLKDGKTAKEKQNIDQMKENVEKMMEKIHN